MIVILGCHVYVCVGDRLDVRDMLVTERVTVQ